MTRQATPDEVMDTLRIADMEVNEAKRSRGWAPGQSARHCRSLPEVHALVLKHVGLRSQASVRRALDQLVDVGRARRVKGHRGRNAWGRARD
jgi:hypothetical protein